MNRKPKSKLFDLTLESFLWDLTKSARGWGLKQRYEHNWFFFHRYFHAKVCTKAKKIWIVEGFFKGRDFWDKKEIFVNSSKNTYIHITYSSRGWCSKFATHKWHFLIISCHLWLCLSNLCLIKNHLSKIKV